MVVPLRTAALAKKANDFVIDELDVVEEAHLKTPSVAKIRLDLLYGRLVRSAEVHKDLFFDVLDHLFDLLLGTLSFLLGQ